MALTCESPIEVCIVVPSKPPFEIDSSTFSTHQVDLADLQSGLRAVMPLNINFARLSAFPVGSFSEPASRISAHVRKNHFYFH